MQYISFIGTGGVNGYEEVEYFFSGDPVFRLKSQFIQEAIVKRHSEINKVFVFATDIAEEKYGDELSHKIDGYCELQYIPIGENDSFETYVSKLLNVMKSEEDVVIDITHSFRSIPMKLLFALRYIELSKNVKIKHLYYGRKMGNKSEIDDLIHDYQLQKISDLLSQFDRTLMIDSKDVKGLVTESDDKIERFIKCLAQFDHMIECCEFDEAIKVIRQIDESCNSIIKNPDAYSLILPLIEKIKLKFEKYLKCYSDVSKKTELVKIVMNHNRKQIAITFIDQLFREELIRNTLMPNNKNFRFENYMKDCKSIRYTSNLTYQFSQHLMIHTYKIRYGKNAKVDNRMNELLKDKKVNIERVNAKLQNRKTDINSFYNDVRNHINHGQSISYDVDEKLRKMIDCIEELNK